MTLAIDIENGGTKMIEAMGRVADRVLGRIAPRIDAAAGCTYEVDVCYCSGHVQYVQKCMWSCPGVPNHCYPCYANGRYC
jgi:hypothetical protein